MTTRTVSVDKQLRCDNYDVDTASSFLMRSTRTAWSLHCTDSGSPWCSWKKVRMQ